MIGITEIEFNSAIASPTMNNSIQAILTVQLQLKLAAYCLYERGANTTSNEQNVR